MPIEKLQHIAGASPLAKAAFAAAGVLCAGATVFGAVQLSAQAFDPSAFLNAGFNRQAQPDYGVAYDVDRSEAEGEANMAADQDEPEPAPQPDIQEVNASSYSQAEGSGSQALSVVDGPAAGGTVTGGQGGEGGTPSDNPLTGPVINGEGNGGDGNNQGGNGDNNQGGSDTPGPIPPAVDSDPRPSLPDDMYGNAPWIEIKPFPEGGVEPVPDEDGFVDINFWAASEEGILQDPDTLGMERLYHGMHLDDWTLLCAAYFYVDVNGVRYRLENYSENFKIGDFPPVVESDRLEVMFSFRPNADIDWWQEVTVDYPVHPYKVLVQDWTADNYLKTSYPAEGESVQLESLYGTMYPASWTDGKVLTELFQGWSETENGPSVGISYTPTEKGRIVLKPVLAPVPSDFIVDFDGKRQRLIDYTGTSEVCAIPEGIEAIEQTAHVKAGTIRIPSSLKSGVGELQATHAYEVSEDSTTFFSQDGVLFDTETRAIFGIPLLQEELVIPEGTHVLNITKNNNIRRIELSEPIEAGWFEYFHDATIVVPTDRYVEFLNVLGEHPGDSSNTLTPSSGETLDYVIRNGAAFSRDEKTLIEVLAETEGVYFVPEGVTTIKAGAFSKSAEVDTVVVPASVTTIEEGALPSEGVRILREGIDSFSKREVNGYQLLQIGTQDGRETILLSAPANVTRFAADTLPGETITSINAGAFKNCKELVFVDMPASVKTIECHAFTGCTKLDMFFSESPDSIRLGRGVFDECSAVRFAAFNAQTAQIYDMESLRTSGFRAFAPNRATGYDDGAYPKVFDMSFIDLTLEQGGTGALLYGTEVEVNVLTNTNDRYVIGASVDTSGVVALDSDTTVIGVGAFEGCIGLTGIDFASMGNVWGIGEHAFDGCTSLSSIALPQSVLLVDKQSFANCTALEQITFNEGLERVGESAFYRCSNLERVTFPSTLADVGYGIFTESGVRVATFSSAIPPDLNTLTPTFPYAFFDTPPERFTVTLAGAATGLQEAYIQKWKYPLIARNSDYELSPEDDLRGTNAARALFRLDPLDALPAANGGVLKSIAQPEGASPPTLQEGPMAQLEAQPKPEMQPPSSTELPSEEEAQTGSESQAQEAPGAASELEGKLEPEAAV